MGFHNPAIPWRQLVGTLDGTGGAPPPDDSPLTRKRGPYRPPQIERPSAVVPYAELHAHSSFSFLDGVSGPAELVMEAERLGLNGLALTDHDGLYGVVRFAEAAESTSVQTVFGAELNLSLAAQRSGQPDPDSTHLVVLAAGEEGYHRLAAAITSAQLAGADKGLPHYDIEALAEGAGGHWRILTGCRKGAVRAGLERGGKEAAEQELSRLVELFGSDRVVVELFDHGHPLDSDHNDVLASLAARHRLRTVATGNVHYATPEQHRLALAAAAIRARTSLDELDGWLPASGGAFLRSGEEMAARFARYPGTVEATVAVAEELAFPLRRARPALPHQEVPAGHTPMSWLRHLVHRAIPQRYPDLSPADADRIEQELAVIEAKGFPGYFLIVHDIVAEARSRGILCQGRGSAASSAVCYLLGITAVDSIAYRLPFERFLSALREEEPDIDVDFDADRREEIIQWVYQRYGRQRAAQVCNVIQYRPRNAIRDVARALGHSPGQADAWARQVERWGQTLATGEHDIPAPVVELAGELLGTPRHLGIHSAGMVLTDRPVAEVVPVERARMENRTVIQWDKDDAAWMGLVKFDLLGLGMLAALDHTFNLVRQRVGEAWELATIPKEEQGVYDMLCRADSIGVFQVESRAQMGLLPRLRPRCFYDLVIQIALIRPGPIQGGAVHPFVRRRLGQETISYVHPKLKPVLERTLGVPVFQEQLMQMAMAVGECSGEDADLLRRAMGSKRGLERIEVLREKLYAGMASNGLTGAAADQIYAQIQAFSHFGFAESHSLSFALLVYASSWLKLHYPAAFLAGLLRAQPMGFYSPATLTGDARRHGVTVLRPDIATSDVEADLVPIDAQAGHSGRDSCLELHQPLVAPFERSAPDDTAEHRRDGHHGVRLGLAAVRGIGAEVAGRIVAERDRGGPYRSLSELVRRTALTGEQVEALAAAGTFDSLGLDRRQALWQAGQAAHDQPDSLPGLQVETQPPLFGDPTPYETLADDLWTTGVSTDDHPMAHHRARLQAEGALASADLASAPAGRRVRVAGLVTHRQRPATAGGVTFLSLEDEQGLVNVIVTETVWTRFRRVARTAKALVVRGMLERSAEGVVNLLADGIKELPITLNHVSRDFQ